MHNPRRPSSFDVSAPPCPALGRMARASVLLTRSMGGGWSAETDRYARILAEMTRLLPGELADRAPCVRSLARASLAGMADRLAHSASLEGWRIHPTPQRTDSEACLGATIARMRLVALNLD